MGVCWTEMYKNIHFLSVKFIIIYSQIYSLSECFTAKEVEKRQNYYQHCHFPGNLCSAGIRSGKFFTEISHPRKWGKRWGSRKLPRPHGHPAHRATPAAGVCAGDVGEWGSAGRTCAATSRRWCSLARLWRCTRALLGHTARHHPSGWAMGAWGGPRSFAACFHSLLGLCLPTTVKRIHVQAVLLKIWWKLNAILAFLSTSQSLPSNNFALISLSEQICASGRVLRLQSLFLLLSLFGVLCMCFKWDGLEFMDGVLPSVFYSLKISKCIHFIFIS